MSARQAQACRLVREQLESARRPPQSVESPVPGHAGRAASHLHAGRATGPPPTTPRTTVQPVQVGPSSLAPTTHTHRGDAWQAVGAPDGMRRTGEPQPAQLSSPTVSATAHATHRHTRHDGAQPPHAGTTPHTPGNAHAGKHASTPAAPSPAPPVPPSSPDGAGTSGTTTSAAVGLARSVFAATEATAESAARRSGTSFDHLLNSAEPRSDSVDPGGDPCVWFAPNRRRGASDARRVQTFQPRPALDLLLTVGCGAMPWSPLCWRDAGEELMSDDSRWRA